MITMTSRITGQSSVSSSVCSDYEQKTWKVRVTISLWGKPPVSGAFPTQMDSNAGIVPFDDVIMSPSHDDAITWNHILYYGLVWGETTADCCFPVCLWWHHPMETLSALLCLLGGHVRSPTHFPHSRLVTRSLNDVAGDNINNVLSSCLWFETSWWHSKDFIVM